MLEALFKRWKQGHGVKSSFPLAGIKLGWASPLSYSIVEWDHRGHEKQRSSVYVSLWTLKLTYCTKYSDFLL